MGVWNCGICGVSREIALYSAGSSQLVKNRTAK